MTAASSFAALFMLPFNLYVYGGMIEGGENLTMDFGSVLLSCLVVIGGTAGGYYVKVRVCKERSDGRYAASFDTNSNVL